MDERDWCVDESCLGYEIYVCVKIKRLKSEFDCSNINEKVNQALQKMNLGDNANVTVQTYGQNSIEMGQLQTLTYLHVTFIPYVL
eukprot:UN12715